MLTPFSPEHIGLAARDTTALKAWYEHVLGAVTVFTDEKTPPAFFIQLPGGMMIEIYNGISGVNETAINSTHGWRHLALRVASIEEARHHLESRGAVFPDPIKPAGGGGRVLFFQDPEGNLLHLIERPAASVFAVRA